MQTNPDVMLLSGMLAIVGIGILVLGLLVMAIGIPFGSLLAAAGVAAVLLGVLSIIVVSVTKAMPGFPMCYVCGGRLS